MPKKGRKLTGVYMIKWLWWITLITWPYQKIVMKWFWLNIMT